MSRQFSLIPAQQMRLEQRLTPQLVQSMEILQLPLPALEARIREELVSNPVLEEQEPEAPERPQPAADDSDASPAADEAAREAKAFEQVERLSREYEFDASDAPFGRAPRANGERDGKLDAMAKAPSRGVSLVEYLESQWAMIEAPDDIKRAGSVILTWMDNDGYLRRESERTVRPDGEAAAAPALIVTRDPDDTRKLMEEIAASVSPPIDPHRLEEALALVQTLEPRGVGARDLTECLLIQLEEMPEAPPLTAELVRHHLHDIGRNRLPAVARATGRSIEEIKEALGFLSKLHHHPGLLVSSAEVPVVVPDVIVEYSEDGDGYTVRLARGNSPRLRISPQYRKLLEERRDDKESREFLRKHIESAASLIDAIQYRRERLLQLAKVVIERQREFLDYGPQFIKVLRMRDLAEEFGCDPSTISRTVDDKYAQTPRGILPLRMFFASGQEMAGGEEVSWDRLRAKVKEIIDAEDPGKPLADDEIAAKMSEQGCPISRRTVAKYRAQLNIPNARERQVF